MTGVSELFGWFVFNVAIPLLAPFALLPFAKVAVFSRSRGQGIVRRAVQDGQLLWAAIPLSASACYGLAGWIDQTDGPHLGAWMFLCLHVLLIVAGCLLVLLGAMDAHPRGRSKRAEINLVLRLSVLLSLLGAAASTSARLALTSTAS
ncbi:hypothetical protein D9X30_0809 [Cupriavidus sp. U2]|uniref:hypothetical protein n=1 Tax=Cupriavidus sp. U2 TaxID=2920269 RepID=UPI00129E3F33|nr:hypothetical protein [Cupriavidus sp. U2]KAI3594577.1 hypothetical protein D9X30_0809 [Cupriavidus sp. U2]